MFDYTVFYIIFGLYYLFGIYFFIYNSIKNNLLKTYTDKIINSIPYTGSSFIDSEINPEINSEINPLTQNLLE